MPHAAGSSKVSLSELAWVFLRLGSLSFGGPVAHIALMEREFVQLRKWLSREELMDFTGAVNLIPGPNSTEIALHIGYRMKGLLGLFTAGLCFILPAFLMVLGLAVSYVRWGSLPEFGFILKAVQPAVLMIILQALFNLGRTALKTKFLTALAFFTALLNFSGASELASLFAGAFFALLVEYLGKQKRNFHIFSWIAVPAWGAVSASPAAAGLIPLFLIFLKTGSVLFGSGYVLFAFLRGDLVQRLHWLTDAQLLDAILAGQITPGPLFTTATFIGYLLKGFPGALLATIGIFLPAFFFVALSGPLIPRIRSSRSAASFLDGLNAASLGLMGVVTLRLAPSALSDGMSMLIFLISGALLWRRTVNPLVLIAVCALAGFLRFILAS